MTSTSSSKERHLISKYKVRVQQVCLMVNALKSRKEKLLKKIQDDESNNVSNSDESKDDQTDSNGNRTDDDGNSNHSNSYGNRTDDDRNSNHSKNFKRSNSYFLRLQELSNQYDEHDDGYQHDGYEHDGYEHDGYEHDGYEHEAFAPEHYLFDIFGNYKEDNVFFQNNYKSMLNESFNYHTIIVCPYCNDLNFKHFEYCKFCHEKFDVHQH